MNLGDGTKYDFIDFFGSILHIHTFKSGSTVIRKSMVKSCLRIIIIFLFSLSFLQILYYDNNYQSKIINEHVRNNTQF